MTTNTICSYKDLKVWQKTRTLITAVYRLSQAFPRDEQYGLTSQLKRAAISISCNIAEGFGRYHFKDKKLFYYNARGSLFEVESLLLIATDLELANSTKTAPLLEQIAEISRMLNGLISATGHPSSDD